MFNTKLKEKNRQLTDKIKVLERRIESISEPRCHHIWKKINKIDGEFINTSFIGYKLTDHNYESTSSEEITIYETTYWKCECIKCGKKEIIKILNYLPNQK